MHSRMLIGAVGICTALSCSSGEHDGHNSGDPTSAAIAEVSYNAVYVVNGGSNSISVLNADTNEVAATVQLSNVSYPHHLYLSPNRESLALAIPGANLSAGHSGGHATHGVVGSVMTLSATKGTTHGEIATQASPHGIAFNADRSTAYVTNQGADLVSVVDVATRTVGKTLKVGAKPNGVVFRAK